MKRVILAAALGSAASLTAATPPPQASGLALRQIQARDYETTADIAFASAMTVLQDAGYRIDNADRDTGLITGTASTRGTAMWLGLMSKKATPVVSVYVEPLGDNLSRVRFNFVLSERKSLSAIANETPITDASVYRNAFEKVEKEIFIRQAMKAGPSAVAAVVAVAPDSGPAAPTMAPVPERPSMRPTLPQPDPKVARKANYMPPSAAQQDYYATLVEKGVNPKRAAASADYWYGPIR